MKGLILGIILIFIFPLAYSQKEYELSHQVMLSAAGLITVGGISYQQTIGETAVEIFVLSPNTLTQGFQQPRFVPKLPLPTREGNGVDFFPNPLTEDNYYLLNIRFYGVMARSYNLVITNILGSVLYKDNIELPADHDYVEQISLTPFGNGIYIAWVRSSDGVINRSFKIDKL